MLLAAGCSAVDREAAGFPEMPHNPVYRRADGRVLPATEAMAGLQAAAGACRDKLSAGGAVPPPVGSPPFDACMRSEGYVRVR